MKITKVAARLAALAERQEALDAAQKEATQTILATLRVTAQVVRNVIYKETVGRKGLHTRMNPLGNVPSELHWVFKVPSARERIAGVHVNLDNHEHPVFIVVPDTAHGSGGTYPVHSVYFTMNVRPIAQEARRAMQRHRLNEALKLEQKISPPQNSPEAIEKRVEQVMMDAEKQVLAIRASVPALTTANKRALDKARREIASLKTKCPHLDPDNEFGEVRDRARLSRTGRAAKVTTQEWTTS